MPLRFQAWRARLSPRLFGLRLRLLQLARRGYALGVRLRLWPPLEAAAGQRGALAGRVRMALADSTEYLDTLADLDLKLKQVDEAFAISDDAGRRILAGFCYRVIGDFPPDPYSAEYRAAQMRLYAAISGRSTYVAAENEYSDFDLAQAKVRPFPYSTGSPVTVGEHLMALGFAIRTMGLPVGTRLVEFGAGWGNITLQLAQLGYEVTAVEVGQAFVDLIRHRAGLLDLEVKLVQADMLAFNPAEKYAAALFFESFHHCADHLQLLKNIYAMLTEDGVAVFAGEPVTDFPQPWGIVRRDGLTLFSMRRYGWLELGFDTSYFLRTLLFYGWLPRMHQLNISVILARKSRGVYCPGEITLPPDEGRTWAPEGLGADPGARFALEHSVISCRRDLAVQSVEFCVSNLSPVDLLLKLSAGKGALTVKVPRHSSRLVYTVTCQDWQGQVEIASQTWPLTAAAPEVGVAVHSFKLNPALP